MAEPVIQLHCDESAGLWIRQLHFLRAGDVHAGHLHSHDHKTLVAHGSVRVTVEGEAYEFRAPHVVTIAKMKRHDLTALEDGTLCYCVASLNDVTTRANEASTWSRAMR
ncbi:hypothetical protein [Candidatus Nitrospira bockiana]